MRIDPSSQNVKGATWVVSSDAMESIIHDVRNDGAAEYTLDKPRPAKSPFGRSQTPKSRGLRQPAQMQPAGSGSLAATQPQ
jgi:hypothetical protein